MSKPSGLEVGTSYFGVRDPATVRHDLDRFVSEGIDGILHTFSEQDRLFYRETMEEIVHDSQERGLNVYINPWGVGNVFGGEGLSQFVGEHQGATQRLSNGQRVPAACFNAPEFKRFMIDWIIQGIEIGTDVIFWDEPHWYEPDYRSEKFSKEEWTCRCTHCRSAYQQYYDESMPDELTERVSSFRQRSITDFLRDMVSETEGAAETVICLEPDSTDKVNQKRLKRFASIDNLDGLAITPFWAHHKKDPADFVRNWTKMMVEVCDDYNINSQVWIQGFNLDNSGQTLEDFKVAIRSALQFNPDSLFIWGWDGCRIMSSIACEDPLTIWETFLEEVNG